MAVVKSRQKTWINAIIIIAFMLLFRFLPPIGPVTPFGMTVLGIFIGMLYGWVLGELIWPSLLGLVLLGLTEGNTVTDVLNTAFMNTTLQTILFSLVFCYGISATGVLDIAAKFILSRKFAQKGPYWLCFAFWLAAVIGGLLTTNALPVTILLWSIFYPVAEQLELQKKSAYVAIMMIGICITSYSGSLLVPYHAFAAVCWGVLASVNPDLQMNFVAYSLTVLAINVVLMPALLAFFKFVIRPKVDYKSLGDFINPEELVLNTRQKIVLVYTLLLCAMMIAPNILPKAWALTGILANLGMNGTFIFILVAMTLTITVSGEELMDIAEGMVKGVPWGLYFLLLAALLISNYIANESTGISALLVEWVSPLLAGRSAFIFMVIMIFIGAVVTNCINNFVTVALLIPISIPFLAVNGGNPLVMATLFAVILLQGVVMPAGSVLGALCHGNDEWLTPGLVYKYATMGELILAIVVSFVGIPVGNFLFTVL